jgi:glycine/D-amino acid oxidase-like deaminating enzyme
MFAWLANMERKNVVICGAGIAGISVAYHLGVKHGLKNILLIDERPPLSLTSDKSTECYRNWWPGPDDAMISLMNRSIDLLEQLAHSSGNSFHLNRRGYLYLTADPEKIPSMIENAKLSSQLGAGFLRIHRGEPYDPTYLPSDPQDFASSPSGADLILDKKLLRNHFPFLTDWTISALHVRRAGWFSAHQLGNLLLEEAKAHGVVLIKGRVTEVIIDKGAVSAILLESGEKIPTYNFVNAAGPFLNQVANTFGIHLPVFCELHLKASMKDHLGVVPRNAPLLIWNDAQKLPWTQQERELLLEDEDSHWLLGDFPPGVHTRPDGPVDSPIILMLWEYTTKRVDPVWPPPLDPEYSEIALRGLGAMLPQMKKYYQHPPRPFLDAGYYTKTQENRPLIGPLPIEGTWVIGALSGFGLMASMAAGELLAKHLLNQPLPAYAPAFNLNRYQDPEYKDLLNTWEDFGQL